jgi:tRNA(fMet)-specific endonuclease VapC
MRILLDTSAYSHFMRGHPEIVAMLRRADEIHVNPITLGELRAGFMREKNIKGNTEELEEFLASPRIRMVSLDSETADRYAVLWNALRRQGTPIPTNDIWIAACAMQHGSEILTTDAHFCKMDQVIVHCCR